MVITRTRSNYTGIIIEHEREKSNEYFSTGRLSILQVDNGSNIVPLKINSTYGADASVLVQMSTESAQTTGMHCYKFPTTADTMYYLIGRLASVVALALALTINLKDLAVN